MGAMVSQILDNAEKMIKKAKVPLNGWFRVFNRENLTKVLKYKGFLVEKPK